MSARSKNRFDPVMSPPTRGAVKLKEDDDDDDEDGCDDELGTTTPFPLVAPLARRPLAAPLPLAPLPLALPLVTW
jgi:hypothetical protein